MMIGVLALQGDFQKHLDALSRCGVEAVKIRTPEALASVDGLIIPGGESTTLGRLMSRWGLDEAIAERAGQCMPIWGTCAGLILLAQEIEGSDQARLGLLDITVRRNAFGRQVDSFETDLSVAGLDGSPFRGVFIRAPIVTRVGGDVEVLAKIDSASDPSASLRAGIRHSSSVALAKEDPTSPFALRATEDKSDIQRIVFVRQGNLWGSAFHPELTDDLRLHQLFAHSVGIRNSEFGIRGRASTRRNPG